MLDRLSLPYSYLWFHSHQRMKPTAFGVSLASFIITRKLTFFVFSINLSTTTKLIVVKFSEHICTPSWGIGLAPSDYDQISPSGPCWGTVAWLYAHHKGVRLSGNSVDSVAALAFLQIATDDWLGHFDPAWIFIRSDKADKLYDGSFGYKSELSRVIRSLRQVSSLFWLYWASNHLLHAIRSAQSTA